MIYRAASRGAASPTPSARAHFARPVHVRPQVPTPTRIQRTPRGTVQERNMILRCSTPRRQPNAERPRPLRPPPRPQVSNTRPGRLRQVAPPDSCKDERLHRSHEGNLQS